MRLKHCTGHRRLPQLVARIRAELGDGALILATRHVGDGVEVTAALEPDESPPPMMAPPDAARLAMLEFHAVPSASKPFCDMAALGPRSPKLSCRSPHCR